LRSPATEQEWASFHRIRRSVLFEKRGLIGVYDPNHPDDRKRTNHPMLLLLDSRHVGVVRIDLAGDTAYLRRVAIDEPWQRQGLGRELIRLAESFAIEHGARRMESSVASDAVGFYDKCGYNVLPHGSPRDSVHMYKDLC
jgi:GNAT superfamily N-acetyltransferase